MVHNLALLLLVVSGSCMEMRETVERMVVVRTTGSDLQPEATGFLYKKESDGPASVVEMGEREVMDHLSKLYEQPKSFAAPIPVAVGPFEAKESQSEKLTSLPSESKFIPVVESQDDKDDPIDGIAKEDYGKMFGEYASDLNHYKSDFDDYLQSLGYFSDGIYHENSDNNEHTAKRYNDDDDNRKKEYGAKHHSKNDGPGDYHSEKYESYTVLGEGDHKKEYDDTKAFGKDYKLAHHQKGADEKNKARNNEGEAVDGFRKLFHTDEYEKDHDYHNREAFEDGFHKLAEGHGDYGSNFGKFREGGSFNSGYHDNDYRKNVFTDSDPEEEHYKAHLAGDEEESSKHIAEHFSTGSGKHHGNSYDYQIKH